MSPLSNSDRPYKSRVLNFVNRLLLRLGDRAQTSLRTLKSATVWGVQIVVYPIYLLVQTSTQIGQQLQNKAIGLLSPSTQQETSSVGSQPTAVVLNSLHPWLENTPYQLLPLPKPRGSVLEKIKFWQRNQEDKKKPKKQPPSPPKKEGIFNNLPLISQKNKTQATPTQGETYLIQGVATYIETGKLVLVTTENQAVDLLSDTQHEQLKERMKILLECYEQLQQPWWWRIASERNRERFHPLRWLSQLMIWIQTSPLAKYLNWFQESQLSFSASYSEISQTPPHSPQTTGIINKIDRVLSRWENTKLRPVIKTIRNWKQELDHQDNNNPILSLIRAAVDYFYGETPQKRLTGNPTATVKKSPRFFQRVKNWINQISGESQTLDPKTGEETDPLTIKRLIQAAIAYFFGQPKNHFSPPPESLESSQEPWLTQADLFGSNESGTENSKDLGAEIARQLNDNYSFTTASPQLKSGKEEEKTNSDSASDWLQAQAIPIGYEKHFLARLLEWLDRALAWLEEKLLQLWNWLKRLIFMKNRSGG